MNLADAYDVLAQAYAEGLAPDPALTIAEWADQYRILPATSAEPGPWRTSRTPYLREIMDALSPSSPIEEVVLKAGAQVGKSECGNNFIGYIMHLSPGPAMLVQPTVDAAKDYTRERINLLIEATPAIAERVAGPRSRDASNTTRFKSFVGGFLAVTGANSAVGLSSKPIRFLFLDEIDRYPLDVDGQGDPVGLAEKRQDTFARKKRLKTSTPTIKGISRIEAEFEQTDQRRYFVPCPHCGHMDWIRWANIHWPENDPDAAYLVCEDCGGLIEERSKPWLLEPGEWRATAVGSNPRVRGYHLSALYSPLGWRSWGAIARDSLKAKAAADRGDYTLKKKFTNLDLGEAFEAQLEAADQEELKKRAEEYPLRLVPLGGLMLVAGVDVQDNRFEIVTWAFGRGEEMWTIDYTVLSANPADERDWDKLDSYLRTRFRHASGQTLGIEAAAVDTGGHFTHQAYNFCRFRTARRIFAVKGDHRPGQPVKGRASKQDVNYLGRVIKKGVKLWHVGADTAKDLIFGRLGVAEPGPGYVHFARELSADFYAQLTAEARVVQKVHGGEQHRWVKKAPRNEVLDCTVYAIFCAHMLDLHRYTDSMWSRLEEAVQPVIADMFHAAVNVAQNATATPESPTAQAQSEPAAAAPSPTDNWKPRSAGWVPRHLR